ncbi:MAG: hypothetical protein PWQ67_1517 [Clostridia bacterium]|nr:hypothetical protein [Clostridia bacterium]MDN5323063.1 hypothetical protein [Clostridia bacterium]
MIDGSLLSKRCGLGPVGFPSSYTSGRPPGGFPLKLPCVSPLTELDYHLVHTLIPNKPYRSKQSRSFPQQPLLIPSLFCKEGFKHILTVMALAVKILFRAIHQHSLKAGYAVPSINRIQVYPKP